MGEGVCDWQAGEVDGAQFFHPLFGEVALVFRVEDLALDQVVALRVGVEQVQANADLEQAGDGRFANLLDGAQLGQALGDGLANLGFLGPGRGRA